MSRGWWHPLAGIASTLLICAVVVLLSGCENQASPSSLPDGATLISKNTRGIWNAPGGARCRWWVQTSKGQITNNGNTVAKGKTRVQKPGRQADQSQTVVLGTGNVGQTLKSDRCGGWRK